MRDGLATLPWVEADTIKPNDHLRQVRFRVRDREKFNLEEILRALGERYAEDVKLLIGPTEN